MRAILPLVLAALSPLLVAALGFTERSLFGTALEDVFYGFFFRAYPLFFFAVVYGVARVVAAAFEPGPRRALRSFTTPIAVALLLVACLYPTFGGLVLRPGFMTGGVSFLRSVPAAGAVVLGAGAAAFAFAVALGLSSALARLRVTLRWRAFGGAILSFLALWLGGVILVIAPRYGFDPVAGWPMRPLSFAAGAQAAALVGLALLPHALVLLARRPARAAGPDLAARART
jgi:hypothetical protein